MLAVEKIRCRKHYPSSSPGSGRDTLVVGDRERFTALAATRKEMVRMLDQLCTPEL
jgi:hypothetical protein